MSNSAARGWSGGCDTVIPRSVAVKTLTDYVFDDAPNAHIRYYRFSESEF